MRNLSLALVAGCVALFGLGAGCDGKATASDPQGATHPGGERSKEYETCSASADCAEGLRCFDGACRRGLRSTVGDYQAARGARAHARGEDAAAIDAYAEAIARYEGDHLPVPPDVDCAYGAALSLAKTNKEKAELSARVLHRCLLAAPVGSALRDGAMLALADLDDVGLDPAHLAKPTAADLYLTRAPAEPATDKLVIRASGEPPPASASFATITDRVTAGDLRPALLACYQTYFATSKKPAMNVALGIKTKYQASGYDDEPGRYVLAFDAAAAAGGPDSDAAKCVRAALEPILTTMTTVKEAFATRLVVHIE